MKFTDWNTATSTIAHKFQQYIEQYGRDSIAFYVSGRNATEDYYVVNKFVEIYLDGNRRMQFRVIYMSSICFMAYASKDLVPASYEDFEYTDMVVLVGSNTVWCHPDCSTSAS